MAETGRDSGKAKIKRREMQQIGQPDRHHAFENIENQNAGRSGFAADAQHVGRARIT